MSDPVAYFSMEIALDPDIPTYSGGLGILAGDTLRSAADMGFPMIGISLVHRKGYFRQILGASGQQEQRPDIWYPEQRLEPVRERTAVMIEDRRVLVRAWRYTLPGVSGGAVPIYLLDTDLPENSDWDRTITDQLYGGDQRYRLCQEVVLGIGGVKLLHRLGYRNLSCYHMNEGHAALLSIALLEDILGDSHLGFASQGDVEEVRRRCVFTTHTPVSAAQDQFPVELVTQVIGAERAAALQVTNCCLNNVLNMTYLALRCSRYINGVAMHHSEVSQQMFPRFPIHAITNGIHAGTWAAPPFKELFDKHLPPWRGDYAYLRYAVGIPMSELIEAHARAKKTLLAEIERRTNIRFQESLFTLGFARRATEYKRADLLFSDVTELQRIAKSYGPIQIVYAGKAHPNDEVGKQIIQRVFSAAAAAECDSLRFIYLHNYDMALAQQLIPGVDLWLNTPVRPLEASGTSGMKAALNGVPSLSVLDGWWIEGCIEGLTGWAIGTGSEGEDFAAETRSMYSKLGQIVAMYYNKQDRYASVMRSTIAINGSFFHTQRMLRQYIGNAYHSSLPGCHPAQ